MPATTTPVLSSAITLAPFGLYLDWVALSMSGPQHLFLITKPTSWIGGHTLLPTTIRTAIMSKVLHLVNTEGAKVLTLAGRPHTKAQGPADWCLVQFSNETLYDGTFVDLYRTLVCMGFTYISVTRMDIAADGIEGNGGDFCAPMQAVFKGAAEYYGKGIWTPRMEGRNKVDGFVLGSPAANKYYRAYDKTRQLKSIGGVHKAKYVRAAWEASLGFDPAADGMTVQRMELRARGKEVRRYFPEEKANDQEGAAEWIESLANMSKRLDIFASLTKTAFDFRTPAIRARDACPIIHWDYGSVNKEPDYRPREKRTLAISENSIKQGIKFMWRISYCTGDGDLLEKAQAIAKCASLWRWYEASETIWQKELQKIYEQGGAIGKTSLEKLRIN